jgi:hypothetical protein
VHRPRYLCPLIENYNGLWKYLTHFLSKVIKGHCYLNPRLKLKEFFDSLSQKNFSISAPETFET